MDIKIVTEETLQEIIHGNLVLLEISGHKIDFKKGMFQKNNISGFESVGYSLLMLIDPKECKKSIPWPLIDDKSLRSEFRTKFIVFIKMVNKKYPEARIPELTSSMLHFPGGMKFLRFMHKLTSLVVELQLKKILGQSEEYESLLQKYEYSKKPRDNSAKLMILRGARYEVDTQSVQYKNIVSNSISLLTQLKLCDNKISENLESVKFNIEIELSHLNLKNDVTKNLLDISFHDAIQEWNVTTNKKVKQLNELGNTMKSIQLLSFDLCEQLREMMTDTSNNSLTQTFFQSPCLDGNKLTASADQLAGRVITNNGSVLKLESLIRAGREEARRLCHSTGQSIPLLPQAQSLLKELRLVQTAIENETAWMNKIVLECDEKISVLRPVLYQGCKDEFSEADNSSGIIISHISESSNKEMAQKIREKVMVNMEENRSKNNYSLGKLRRSGSMESFVTPNKNIFKQCAPSQKLSISKPKYLQYTPYLSGKKKNVDGCSNENSTNNRNKVKSRLRKSSSLTSLKKDIMELQLDNEEISSNNSSKMSSVIFKDSPEPSSSLSKFGYSKIPIRSRHCPPTFSQQENDSLEMEKRFSEVDKHSAEEESEVENNETEIKRKSLDLIVARFLKIKQSMNKPMINTSYE